MTPNGHLLLINRRMNVEGRINLVFEELGTNQTRVSANTRYVLTRLVDIRPVQGMPSNRSDTISFNSGGRAAYPRSNDGQAVECVSMGTMEEELLSIIN